MPSNKKKKNQSKRKSKAATAASGKKTAQRKRVAKSKTAKKPLARKAAQKIRASGSRKKRASISTEWEINQDLRSKNLIPTGRAASRQSEGLQGLSRVERADSESVDELAEEGNLFEAGAVAGVEDADNSDEREVHTHEMPEDDVPEEYLDEK